ncbi:molybdopterin-dependent oxidoreductase [Hymenobacter profundi]|uniref:Molybdopterin-dependent oxidoreductase n=1 Tax=Hymenobacter profundi TaxID=1982110 RepID=A0ABS6WXE8_9BACT|nr:molybdopterin-dependent oxidoreductase [Hymenobacter profundi]MBW3127736.1 molybdopterin-dependent oxidoreductase [Hymenobacter profundi]
MTNETPPAPPAVNVAVPAPASEAAALQAATKRSRRSFIGLGLAGLAGLAGWRYLLHTPEADGLPVGLRNVLDFNAQLTQAYSKHTRLAPEFTKGHARRLRANGDVGLGNEFDPATWQLTVQGYAAPGAPARTQHVTLADVKALPRTEMTTEFKCIEGWSVVVTWAGVRLTDFLARYPLATASGQPILNPAAPPADVARYASFVTPDEAYYVGLEQETVLHPQTLLCYELNGQPLPLEHGAPLRLVTPLKYGIKHLKRIGTIAFTDTRPADYWAERGYDWYAGH